MEYICPEAGGLHQDIEIMTMDRFHINTLIRAAALAAVLLVFAPEVLTAQSYTPTPVTISKEKVKIDGKICYSHIVLERQTLYSISKAYNVSIEDIYRFNPTLKETGLKKNGIIIIPSADAIEEKKAEEQAPAIVAEETKTEQETAVKEVPKKVKRKTHTVQWFEDLDVIAEKYGVSVDALIKFNNLPGRKLASRQKLIIPESEDIAQMALQTPEQETQEAVAETSAENIASADTPEQETVQTDIHDTGAQTFTGKDVKAAILLPLNATGSSSHRGNMDFYSGMLLAVSDLTDTGVNVDLKVCDTQNGLPSLGYTSSCDFVIGPIATADLAKTLEMNSFGPYVISPLDQRAQSLASSYEKLIQAPTPHGIQYKDLINWIKEDTQTSDRVIFITEKGARQTEVLTQLQTAIDSSGVAYRNFSYSILEGRDIMNPLMALMTQTGANRVVIASESEAFVNDVVRNLNLIEYQKYDVVLYSPSKIRNFETIDVDNIHNTTLHTSLAYYINYEDPKVKSFLMKYRAMFNTEPTQFAFQGYDIASYFCGLVSRYGDRWIEMLTAEKSKMLQSTFEFRKNPDGGYINNGVRRIIYEEGWTVKELD